jgi:hypothetical protein
MIVWVWRNLSDAADEIRDRAAESRPPQSAPAASGKSGIVVNPSSTQEERDRASKEWYARTDRMAYDLIEKWNRDPVINLASDELPAAVESLPEADCILLPEGAIAINSASLPAPVKRDLNTAVTGLLHDYRDATPDAVIEYMSERGKVVNPDERKRMERALVKQGKDLEKLSDEDVYRTMCTTFKANAHWSGLVADSSCRQFWDGKKVPFNRVGNFSQSFVAGVPTKPMDQTDYLTHLLRGTTTGPHNFVSTNGSLEEAHETDAQVLLCDLQLVMELDELFSRVKAPYLIRFWFNNAQEKWQPIAKISFSPTPKGGPLPFVPF